jgi:hypothetical protein
VPFPLIARTVPGPERQKVPSNLSKRHFRKVEVLGQATPMPMVKTTVRAKVRVVERTLRILFHSDAMTALSRHWDDVGARIEAVMIVVGLVPGRRVRARYRH